MSFNPNMCPFQLQLASTETGLYFTIKSSIESQKGAIAVQRCSVEIQKSAIALENYMAIRC